jgi:bifunctional DNase/RNase
VAAGPPYPDPDFVTVELATVGVDASRGTPVVLLRHPASGQVIPIWVGLTEANAIARALHGVELPRPMTHDLLGNLLRELGAEVVEVQVHALKEETYLGRIRLLPRGDSVVRDVDSRPSDALALALRVNAPIRVLRVLLREAPPVDFIAPESEEQVVHSVGLTVVKPTAELRRSYKLPSRDGGLVVTRARGEAQAVGLKPGDLIVQVNGIVPRQPMDFFEAVRATAFGHPVRVRYWREGRETEVELHPRILEPPREREPVTEA